MSGCSSSFGASNVVAKRNEVVLRKICSQNLGLDSVRFRSMAKEVALPIFCGNRSFRNGLNSISVKKERNNLVMSMLEPRGGRQFSLGAVTVSNEGGGAALGKDARILENEGGSKPDYDGNGAVLDGSGGNGKYPNGRGGDGGGGGGGGGGNDDGEDGDEEEFGPILKFEEVMKETEARGASLPLDMLEAAKNVGIRKVLLLRYLDLQVYLFYVSFPKSCMNVL